MKKAIFAMMLVVCLLLTGCDYHKRTDNYETYLEYMENNYYATEFLPTAEDIGEYENMIATYKRSGIICVTNTVALFLDYDAENYKKQIEYINENYSFFEKSPSPEHLDVDAIVNDYIIKTVKETKSYKYIDPQSYYYQTDDTWYHDVVQNALLIGFNEQERKVCYLYRNDDSLDVIDDLDDHINNYFYFA